MKAKKLPEISVLLAVYNGQDHLAEAIDSILGQSYPHFELIIVNDGSTDDSAKIIKSYAQKDARIVTISQKNKGLVASLNTAASKARAPILARMDADDISHASRFDHQIQAMWADPRIVALGSDFSIMDESGSVIEHTIIPTTDAELRRELWVRNPFAHGSMMFRKSAFEAAGGYSDSVGPLEDYDLWVRLAEHGTLASIDKNLFSYRISPDGISVTNQSEQIARREAHIAARWQRSRPQLLSRSNIANYAASVRAIHPEGEAAVRIARSQDTSVVISIKLLRSGQILSGLSQFFAVLTSGHSGIKAIARRAKLIMGMQR